MTDNPINFNGLDSAVYGPVRLGVLTALQMDGSLDFTTLKKRLEVADGALGLHLGKLEEIGYLTCRKAFVGKRPKSTYMITVKGKRALANYLDEMQRLIDAIGEFR
ncbi:MAG: transcriptional regulator [Planctomycetaceae bacterium]|nr:transcriptional regulator [Planctomycetaceae bacterium]